MISGGKLVCCSIFFENQTCLAAYIPLQNKVKRYVNTKLVHRKSDDDNLFVVSLDLKGNCDYEAEFQL